MKKVHHKDAKDTKKDKNVSRRGADECCMLLSCLGVLGILAVNFHFTFAAQSASRRRAAVMVSVQRWYASDSVRSGSSASAASRSA